MAKNVQKFREIVFQLLYSYSFEKEQELFLLMRHNTIPKSLATLAKEKTIKILEKKEELDRIIISKAIGYDLKRISRIEKAILQLGLYELLYTDLPSKVAIAEAIRLARKFSTREAGTFINAILDIVYKEKQALQEVC